MADNVDKRKRLEAEPFSYKTSKDGKVFIYWEHKQVMVLKEKKAQALLKKIENKESLTVQLELAKITGNFKHGNER